MSCERCGKCCHAFGITLSIEDMNREPRLWDVAVPMTMTSKCQNKELGPITGEWWL